MSAENTVCGNSIHFTRIEYRIPPDVNLWGLCQGFLPHLHTLLPPEKCAYAPGDYDYIVVRHAKSFTHSRILQLARTPHRCWIEPMRVFTRYPESNSVE